MNTYQKSYIRTEKSKAVLLLSLTAGLLSLFIVSLCVGSANIATLPKDTALRILFLIRLPRTVGAVFSGAALAVSGVIIQTVLGNSLAGPGIIGVNAGAGLFTLLAVAFFPALVLLIPSAAFVGALCAGLVIFLLSSKTGANKLTVILAGVAVNSILSACTDAITVLDTDLIYAGSSFMIGGFSGTTFASMTPALIYITVGIFSSFIMAGNLNLLRLGDSTAKSLGMNVKAVRFLSLCIASVLAGAAVSYSGLLGFVGLIVPHISRRLVGTDSKILLPFSALSGAFFVLLCDTLCRVIFAPFELPVGIIMSLIGGPFFLFLLLRRKEVL